MSNNSKIKLIGIGVFAWLASSGFTYLFGRMLYIAFITADISPKVNFYVSEGFKLFFFIFLLVFFVKWLSKRNLDEKFVSSVLLGSIIALFASQILQYAFNFYVEDYVRNTFPETVDKYFDALRMGEILVTSSILELIKYLLAGIIFYKSDLFFFTKNNEQ